MPSEGKSAGRDAPAESKYAPASSASRGAKGGGLEDDAEDMKLPELVTKFAHLVMSERYRANIEAWKRKHADEFVDANAEDEQKLEWTAAFQLYVKLVEGELEGFCQTNQVEPSEVFGVIGEAMNGPLLDEEFLPAILQVADYDYFLTQMALLANEKRYSELAEDRSRAADDPTCVSGSWALDTKQSTLSNVDEFLSATRVPKVFRGLAKGFIYKNNVLNIIQANGRITLYFNSPTGRRKEVYHTDGEKHDMVNVWGKSVPVRCTVARDGTVGTFSCGRRRPGRPGPPSRPLTPPLPQLSSTRPRPTSRAARPSLPRTRLSRAAAPSSRAWRSRCPTADLSCSRCGTAGSATWRRRRRGRRARARARAAPPGPRAAAAARRRAPSRRSL